MRNYSSNLLNAIDQIVRLISYQRKYCGEWINIWKKRELIKDTKLNKQEKKQIDAIWKANYGKRIPYYWHRLYKSYLGKFDPYYFPEILYSTILEKKMNDPHVALAFEDKSQLDILLRTPNADAAPTVPTLVFNTQGVFYNRNHEIVDIEIVLDILNDVGKCVIKPSVDSDSGKNVRVLNIKDGIDVKTGDQLKTILSLYKTNFLVQEYIEAHPLMKRINPTSVNTLRIMTYSHDNVIYHAPVGLRMGATDSEIDNTHAGGLFIGVSESGQLNDCAFTEFGQRIYRHPVSDICFKDVIVPNFKDAIGLVERLHCLIPRLTFISWDVAITKDGTPIIIEINTRNQAVWFSQIANGKSFFGDYTEDMIKKIKKNE